MNYMPKVLEMLNLEVGEKFNIKGFKLNPYQFDDEFRLVGNYGHEETILLKLILCGDYEIEKLPWKPKEDDEYYIVCENENIVKCRWSSRSTNSFYRYNAGNCFKTKEEITPEIKQLILQEMKGKYEND